MQKLKAMLDTVVIDVYSKAELHYLKLSPFCFHNLLQLHLHLFDYDNHVKY